ncbi:MAG: class I SAM-dependent methyltransferase [Pseudomonadota bacterium]
MSGGGDAAHARLMDGVYRSQRHIYDATRKYYLLGRDRLIRELKPAPGHAVLEVGCGTGRNMILAARRYPQARFYGFDISEMMLETAQRKIDKAGLSDRITLAQGDASDFSMAGLFGVEKAERVFCSYTLSMIPPWRAAIEQSLAALTPGGELHVVDFGQQERLPAAARALLGRWLALFHVTARPDLRDALEQAADAAGRELAFTPLYRGYTWLGAIR